MSKTHEENRCVDRRCERGQAERKKESMEERKTLEKSRVKQAGKRERYQGKRGALPFLSQWLEKNRQAVRQHEKKEKEEEAWS